MTDMPLHCQRVIDDGLDELYVAGRLHGEGLEAFEQHYFGCGACFERVALLHATRAHLGDGERGPAAAAADRIGWRSRRWTVTAGVAACLLAAVWLTPRSTPPTAEAPAGVPAHAVAAPVRGLPPFELPPFEPPSYRPQTLRSAGDAAAEQFRTAMRLYVDGRFADAIPGLAQAAHGRVDAAFFLAACRLLTGDATGAASAARQAVAFGDTPYVEEARLVLARALAQLGDVDAARAELTRVTAMQGERTTDAADLLRRLSAGAQGVR